jgi:hypothetical protein
MARYEFIDAEKATRNTDGTVRYTIVKMCAWLAVSTSGYYEWLARPASATATRRERLKLLIEIIEGRHLKSLLLEHLGLDVLIGLPKLSRGWERRRERRAGLVKVWNADTVYPFSTMPAGLQPRRLIRPDPAGRSQVLDHWPSPNKGHVDHHGQETLGQVRSITRDESRNEVRYCPYRPDLHAQAQPT